MRKNSTKSNMVIAIITFVLIVAFAGYFIKSSIDREAREKLESVALSKERSYNDYIKSIEKIVNSKKQSDQVEVAKISKEALYKIVEYDEYYKETKDGNEYLEKLEKEATKNINSSLNFLLSNNISKNNYEEIRIFADNPNYVSKENIALFESVKEEVNKSIAQDKQAQRESLGTLKTGLTESEVELLLGSPLSVTKNDEAEFWTYESVVLTMKKGYVFDIVYSNE